MKSLAILIVLIVTQEANAGMNLKRVKAYVSRHNYCEFTAAVTFSTTDKGKQMAAMCGGKAGDLNVCGVQYPDVLCAYYTTIDPNGANARSGCVVGLLSTGDGNFQGFFQSGPYAGMFHDDDIIDAAFLKGQRCTKAALTTLLTRPSEPRIINEKVGRGGQSVWQYYKAHYAPGDENKIEVIIDKAGIAGSLR